MNSNEKIGIHRVLEIPTIYNVIESLLGARNSTGKLIREHIKLKLNDKVLDFGSGTGSIFQELEVVQELNYTAIEPNSKYVNLMNKKYGDRNNFRAFQGSVEVLDDLQSEFDVVLIIAVLHHIEVEKWKSIISGLLDKLTVNGRIIVLDPIKHEHQNPLARMIINFDRGKSILFYEEYKEIIDSLKVNAKYHLRKDLLRVPYSHIITEISKNGNP
jgi:phospholipid N-methyltransferase